MSENIWGIDHIEQNLFNKKKQLQHYNNEMDKIFKQCFETDYGKQVLEILERLTINQASWNPNRPAEFGYFREGQNNIINYIKRRINNGK